MNEKIRFRVYGEEHDGNLQQVGRKWKAYGYIDGQYFEGEPASTPSKAIENLEGNAERADFSD